MSTKEYVIRCKDGRFKMFLSKHSDGSCFAAVLYYSKNGSWSQGQTVDIELKYKTFFDSSEKSVFGQSTAWIKGNIDANAIIDEVKA